MSRKRGWRDAYERREKLNLLVRGPLDREQWAAPIVALRVDPRLGLLRRESLQLVEYFWRDSPPMYDKSVVVTNEVAPWSFGPANGLPLKVCYRPLAITSRMHRALATFYGRRVTEENLRAANAVALMVYEDETGPRRG